MSKKVYVGNLPYDTKANEVRELFHAYEPIYSVMLKTDHKTGQPCGYGFVELEEPCANAAIYEMENRIFNGRNLKIGWASGKRSMEREGWNHRVDSPADKGGGWSPEGVNTGANGAGRGGTAADESNYGNLKKNDTGKLIVIKARDLSQRSYCNTEECANGIRNGYQRYRFNDDGAAYCGPMRS